MTLFGWLCDSRLLSKAIFLECHHVEYIGHSAEANALAQDPGRDSKFV